MNKYQDIENLIFNEKNYNKALEYLNALECTDNNSKELKAYVLFSQNKFEEASMIYAELNRYFEIGYCNMLMGNIQSAISFFKKAIPSPIQNWELFFCGLFTEKIDTVPTYLQIRAFLEKDLTLFLKLNLIDFVQKIIDISEYLAEINPDTNKYIAKAFLYNDCPDYAIEFINRGFDYTASDAELYYLKALYYKDNNSIKDAKNSLIKALELNNNFIPAQNLLEIL